MTDYTELVEALRCKSLSKECDPCNYGYRLCPDSECNDACHVEQIYADAAAAIEALQAELEKKRTADCWGCKCEKLEPKRGEWIEENRRPRSSQFVCSECHRTAYDPQPTRDKAWRKRCRYAYCPNCGADMRKMEVQE